MKRNFDDNSIPISAFLRGNIGLYYCDDCLHEEMPVATRWQVSGVRRMFLGLPLEFDRGTECDSCSRKMKTIAYLPRIY